MGVAVVLVGVVVPLDVGDGDVDVGKGVREASGRDEQPAVSARSIIRKMVRMFASSFLKLSMPSHAGAVHLLQPFCVDHTFLKCHEVAGEARSSQL